VLGNGAWRFRAAQLDGAVRDRLRGFVELYGR
jgi:hypothetical protein